MLKRGYKNGAKTIEIIEGNLDLVLYNEKGDSFYYYRFSPEDIIGERVSRSTYLVYPNQVKQFLARYGREYDGLINELIQLANDNGMRERYDM